MKKELSKRELELFDLVLRELSTAIKNSVLYSTDHPLFVYSIDNLKRSLEKWFEQRESLDLGFSHDNILLGGVYVKEGDQACAEVASYLHSRGMIAISFLRGIEPGEMADFFRFIKNDVKTIRKKQGVLNNIPTSPHLRIKEIDYSLLLSSEDEEEGSKEEEIWAFLSKIAEEASEGQLPESRMEFLRNFLKDPDGSSAVLNSLYKRAVARLEDEDTVRGMRRTITQICAFLGKQPGASMRELKGDLTRIISRLHPDLVARLFEKTVLEGKEYDLAKELTEGLSDNFIAGFIESLISSEDFFNENLLKVFDKLAPEEETAGGMATMVADILYDKGLLKGDSLSKLQMSIKEVFSRNPNSSFMSQMYRMTVDTFVNRKIETLVYMSRLLPLAGEYMRSVKEDKLNKGRVDLLLNLLYLEDVPGEFKKLGEKLMDAFPHVLERGDMESLRKALELLSEGLRPGQKKNYEVSFAVRSLIRRLTGRGRLERIISFIPGASETELEDISGILARAGSEPVGLLLDAFTFEKAASRRRKLGQVLARMKSASSKDLLEHIGGGEPAAAVELFRILKQADPEKAREASKRLLNSGNEAMRLECLEGFLPGSGEEEEMLLRLLKREKSGEVREKAARALLQPGSAGAVDRLFSQASGFFAPKGMLRSLVQMCGQMRVEKAAPHLVKVFAGRYLINNKRTDDLRVAAAVSLGRLGSPEAIETLKRGLNDKRERVRGICGIILKLDESGRGEPEDAEGADEA